MADGLQWLEYPVPLPGGYCTIFTRGIDSEDLVRRLVSGAEPRFIGLRTHKAFEADLFQLDRSKPVDTTVGVRYGSVGDLSFSIGYGPWQETLSQFDTPEISHGGAHTYELYFMAEHPNVPPPHFRYNHDGVYEVMCDLNNDDWVGVVNVLGNNAELVAALEADKRRPMEILEQRFGLTLPKEAILTGTLPAAIIKT
ncbi:hypothetical protein ACFOZ0_33060 [Streptomyces yaanensis]|uniref:Uncharacterized protein n=1 Tax=Streptomyces yaanensis TaxID=1142239 RepID=A0ABV7SRR6_9ACTN|nr:hypothetical protein [Streptomyces sp. CGMCC 4.7035]WNB99431.1 hypothetical protein Q2K21_15850 [Streptomyces sp. CGMCC 4.7035]